MILLSERVDLNRGHRGRGRVQGGMDGVIVAMASEVARHGVEPWPLWLSPQSTKPIARRGYVSLASLDPHSRRRAR